MGPPPRGPPAPQGGQGVQGITYTLPPKKGPAPELLYIRSTSKDHTSVLALVLQGKVELRWILLGFVLGFYRETLVLGGPRRS